MIVMVKVAKAVAEEDMQKVRLAILQEVIL